MLDILIIGAGFGGLCMAAKAQKKGLSYLVLERAGDVGGTWRDNTYPGCACDTQSHHYSFSFATNPDWSRRYASQREILDYLRNTAKDLALTSNIRFNQKVTALIFDEEASCWTAKTKDGETFKARFAVSAVGQLNQPSIPDFEGLDCYKGVVMHTAEWDHDYDFTNKTIAVVGSGASAIQLIPPLAEQAAKMTVFQRSPHWVIGKDNRPFKPWQKILFRCLPFLRRLYRAQIYWDWEKSWKEFLQGSEEGKKRTAEITSELHQKVPDADLAQKIIPTDPLGCKRILLTDDYLPALQRDSVSLVTDGIARIEEDAVVTATGQRFPVDCIVMATGFKSHDFLPGITVTGGSDCDLQQQWRNSGGAEAYLGITMPYFPNLFLMYGPNTNLGHNSIVFMLECQSTYIMDAINTVKRQNGSRIVLRKNVMERFMMRMNHDLRKTVWAGSCTSWYKTDDGKIVNNWSEGTIAYWWETRRIMKDEYLIS